MGEAKKSGEAKRRKVKAPRAVYEFVEPVVVTIRETKKLGPEVWLDDMGPEPPLVLGGSREHLLAALRKAVALLEQPALPPAVPAEGEAGK